MTRFSPTRPKSALLSADRAIRGFRCPAICLRWSEQTAAVSTSTIASSWIVLRRRWQGPSQRAASSRSMQGARMLLSVVLWLPFRPGLRSALTVGPQARIEFKRLDDGSYVDVEMSRSDYSALRDRLALKNGSRVFLKPRRVTRFAVSTARGESELPDPAAMI